jgi:hypothetical protein
MAVFLPGISTGAARHSLYGWMVCGMFFGPLAMLLR